MNRKGTFAEARPLRPGAFHRCVWVDYDHDYDLDLLLLGAGQAMLRNNGDGTWTDVSSSFPFVAGEALDGRTALDQGAGAFDGEELLQEVEGRGDAHEE